MAFECLPSLWALPGGFRCFSGAFWFFSGAFRMLFACFSGACILLTYCFRNLKSRCFRMPSPCCRLHRRFLALACHELMLSDDMRSISEPCLNCARNQRHIAASRRLPNWLIRPAAIISGSVFMGLQRQQVAVCLPIDYLAEIVKFNRI